LFEQARHAFAFAFAFAIAFAIAQSRMQKKNSTAWVGG
jgi:hypothetical protein